MNNVYDSANKLAADIKNSEEYNLYKKARIQVMSNPELKEKVNNFEKIRYDMQVLEIEKGQESLEKKEKLQEMYKLLIENKDLKEYFDLEVRFNVMVADINKIIAESMEDIFNIK